MVAILGIMGAIALPAFQEYITAAKGSAARDNLRILRNAIELYAAQHNGVPPGYLNDDPSKNPAGVYFYKQIVLEGHYMNKLPTNPFNGDYTLTMIKNDQDFPEEANGERGWMYQPATKTIKLNWPGTDPDGISYFDY